MFIYSPNCNITDENKQIIESSLPEQWDTEIREINASNNLELFIRINAKTIDEIEQWVHCYQQKTNSSYSVETTYKCSGQRVLFKKSYHCHHKTRHKKTYDPVFRKNVKNTNCPSVFSVALRTIKTRYQGKDKEKAPDCKKPCEIRIKLKHNHAINNSMALKFKKVLPEVKDELMNLFKKGHTATTARQMIKTNIRLNNENYVEIFNDRSKCPEYSYCHYLYQKYLQNFSENIKFNNEFIKTKIDNYNTSMNEISASFTFNENSFIICFCPPLIKRIHQYHQLSGEIVYLDSFPINEQTGSRIFFLLTPSDIGGLPLGLFITSTNNIFEIQTGLLLLKDLLNNIAFFGKTDGPKIFLSDENIVKYNIINSVWPNTKNLINTFHILQNVWKWLLNCRNIIDIPDRVILFRDFYNIVYSPDEDELLKNFDIAKQNGVKYKHYLKHLDNYFEKRYLWATCYRTTENINYSDYIMRVLRDKIFQRLIVFNLIQTIDFIINYFFMFFEKRILNAVYNQQIKNVFYDNLQAPSDEILNSIQTLGTNVYLVPTEKIKNLFYMVNFDLLTCTCFNGYSNSVCKHVQWICAINNIEEKNQIENIQNFYIIAKGHEPPEDLFKNLNVESFENDSNHELYEEICENNSDELNNYLLINNIQNCTEKWSEITKKVEELIEKNPEEMLPTLKILSSRFDKVKCVSDLRNIFSIFDK